MYGTGNKGEWSELYTVLKLLADGQMYGADQDVNIVKKWLYQLTAINHKTEGNKTVQYQILSDIGAVRVSVQDEANTKDVLQKDIAPIAIRLLKAIKDQDQTTFSVDFLNQDLESLAHPKLKASSTQKQDISVVINDSRLCREQEVGFSIKSQLGGASTLFNAGKNTNFIFEIEGAETLSVDQINKLKELKSMALIKKIHEYGSILSFKNVQGKVLASNLKLIDTGLEHIWADMLSNYYQGKGNKLEDLCNLVADDNPLAFTNDEKSYFYAHKVKQFLSAVALGMVPSSPWYGTYDATGGYIIVKEDGELACYHIYNWNAFQDYLFSNTKLETGSTTRHEFGRMYESEGKWFVKLNLQVRFI